MYRGWSGDCDQTTRTAIIVQMLSPVQPLDLDLDLLPAMRSEVQVRRTSTA
jgi:hypothetical protein